VTLEDTVASNGTVKSQQIQRVLNDARESLTLLVQQQLRPESALFSKPYFNMGFIFSAVRGQGRGAFVVTYRSWKEAQNEAGEDVKCLPVEWMTCGQIYALFHPHTIIPYDIRHALETYNLAETSMFLVVVRPQPAVMVFHLEPYHYIPIVDDVIETGFYRIALSRCYTCSTILTRSEVASEACKRCINCKCVVFCSDECAETVVPATTPAPQAQAVVHAEQCSGSQFMFIELTSRCDIALDALKYEEYGLSLDTMLDPLQTIHDLIRYEQSKRKHAVRAHSALPLVSVTQASSSSSSSSSSIPHSVKPIYDRNYFSKILGTDGSRMQHEQDLAMEEAIRAEEAELAIQSLSRMRPLRYEDDASTDDDDDGDDDGDDDQRLHSDMRAHAFDSLQGDPEHMLTALFSHMQGKKNSIDIRLDALTQKKRGRVQLSATAITSSRDASASSSSSSVQSSAPKVSRKHARSTASNTTMSSNSPSSVPMFKRPPVKKKVYGSFVRRQHSDTTHERPLQRAKVIERQPTRSDENVHFRNIDDDLETRFSIVGYGKKILEMTITRLNHMIQERQQHHHSAAVSATVALASPYTLSVPQLFLIKGHYERMLVDVYKYLL